MLQSSAIEAEMVGGKRFYSTPAGVKVPSVTTVLGAINAKGIAEWRARVGEERANQISQQASSRGTKVHSIAEQYVLNNPKYAAKVMPSHLEMFNAIKHLLDRHVNTIYGCEIGLYSTELMMAGRCDLICDWKGRPTIVDFKTASKPKSADYIRTYFLQVAAYATMCNELYGTNINHYAILIATEHDGAQVFEGTLDRHRHDLLEYLKETNHVESVRNQQQAAC